MDFWKILFGENLFGEWIFLLIWHNRATQRCLRKPEVQKRRVEERRRRRDGERRGTCMAWKTTQGWVLQCQDVHWSFKDVGWHWQLRECGTCRQKVKQNHSDKIGAESGNLAVFFSYLTFAFIFVLHTHLVYYQRASFFVLFVVCPWKTSETLGW